MKRVLNYLVAHLVARVGNGFQRLTTSWFVRRRGAKQEQDETTIRVAKVTADADGILTDADATLTFAPLVQRSYVETQKLAKVGVPVCSGMWYQNYVGQQSFESAWGLYP